MPLKVVFPNDLEISAGSIRRIEKTHSDIVVVDYLYRGKLRHHFFLSNLSQNEIDMVRLRIHRNRDSPRTLKWEHFLIGISVSGVYESKLDALEEETSNGALVEFGKSLLGKLKHLKDRTLSKI